MERGEEGGNEGERKGRKDKTNWKKKISMPSEKL